jgi:hypothetical protein
MVKKILLPAARPVEWVHRLRGRYVDERHFHTLVSGEDMDVLKPDGSPLLLFRHQVLPPSVIRRAYEPLVKAAIPSTNRGMAAGGRYRRIRNDGTRTNTTYSEPVLSGIIGYADPSHRIANGRCRTTVFTAKRPKEWAKIVPFIQAVNAVFRCEAPERYAAQMAMVERTPRRFVIPGTAFTTVTVNRNWRTAVHVDAGDYRPGFGVMSVLQGGQYEGGYLVFPRFGVAVDMRTRDVLLADVHEEHGNSPIVGEPGKYERISTILYYRTRMRRCP